jgi:hypothetical protein
MSMWGCVSGDDGWLHIVPVSDDGKILEPHICESYCKCGPQPDEECPDSMLVHQDHERGGANA